MTEPEGISEVAQSVRRDKLSYLTTTKFQRLEAALQKTLTSGVDGDVLEFGIALGGSAIVLAKIAGAEHRTFHGFDLFGRIPEPTSDKDDDRSKARFQVIASGQSRGIGGDLYYGYRADLFSEVCEAFQRYGMPVDNRSVVLHRGLFQDTWSLAKLSSVAFAHIDCDWHDPVKFCLESVFDVLSPGGAIVLDDYHDYGGCKVATDEFLQAHPDVAVAPGRNLLLVKAS